jgi:homoaconitate hydratase
VVAASAVAGYICGPDVIPSGRESRDLHLERRFKDLSTGVKVEVEKVSILPGFPARVRGRLVFVPKDNLNTDAIYPGTYTYREDVTPEMMARVVMENYDPEFAAKTSPGDVLVGGFNFGSGSSREQAVTALKAKGIALVIAGSFSQTYLRNAFNNGFLCIEVPELVKRLRERLTAKEKTIIPGQEIEVDFTASTLTWGGDVFHFPALGSVPQSLVIAGGVEKLVASRICNW